MRTHAFVILTVTVLAMGSLLVMRAAEARGERLIYVASSEREERSFSSRTSPTRQTAPAPVNAPPEATSTPAAATSTEEVETDFEAPAGEEEVLASTTPDEEGSTHPPEAPEVEAVGDVEEEEVETEPAPIEERTEEPAPESANVVEPPEPEPEPEPVSTVTEPPTTARAADETNKEEANDLSYPEAVAKELHRLTNDKRQAEGLSPLSYDAALADVAHGHSKDMVARDFFSHEDPEGCDMTCRFAAVGYEAKSWGENIAWRSFTEMPEPAVAAQRFLDAWMTSTHHRQNLLSEDYTLEGIGVVEVENKLYITVNFAAPW